MHASPSRKQRALSGSGLKTAFLEHYIVLLLPRKFWKCTLKLVLEAKPEKNQQGFQLTETSVLYNHLHVANESKWNLGHCSLLSREKEKRRRKNTLDQSRIS
jgi:hypothetical protein